jgi:hypothetical protein
MKNFLILVLLMVSMCYGWSLFGSPDTVRAGAKVAAPLGEFDSTKISGKTSASHGVFDSVNVGELSAGALSLATDTEYTTYAKYYYGSPDTLLDSVNVYVKKAGTMTFVTVSAITGTLPFVPTSTRIEIPELPSSGHISSIITFGHTGGTAAWELIIIEMLSSSVMMVREVGGYGYNVSSGDLVIASFSYSY